MRRNVLLLVLVLLLAATACQNSELKFRKHLDVAQEKIFSGEYEVARIEVLNALKIDPSSSRAYFLMSQALAGMKNYRGAVRALANANELAPDNREIALEYDQLLYAGRAYSMAESLASSWTTRSPEDRDFLTLLSLTQARLGKASDAVETASRMVELFPGEAASWLNMARVTLIIEDQEAALEALGKAEKLDPDSIEVSVLRVDLLMRQGRTNEAVNHLEALTSSNPDRQDLKVRLARLYEGEGRKSDAVRVYQEIAQVEPEASVLYRLGVLFIEAGRKDEAVDLWVRSVEVDPYFNEPRLSLVRYYMTEKDLTLALNTVNEALKYTPQEPQALALRGQVHLAQGRAGDAVSDLQKAIDSRPGLVTLRLLLAQAQLQTGEAIQARENLMTFVAQNPHHPLANLLLAKMEASVANFEESSNYASAASVDDVHGKEAMWIIGDNDLRHGRIEQARMIYERNLNRFGPHPETRIRIARSKELLGEFEQAEDDYRSILNERPDDMLPLTHLVSVLGRTGREDEALALVREKAKGGGARQLILLGRLLEMTGDISEAREVYLSLTQAYPELIMSYRRVIALYARESKLDEAEVWLTESIGDSDAPPVHLQFLLGMIQDATGRDEAAVQTYRKLLAISPEFVPAMNNLAWRLSESGKMNESLEIAARARKLAPEDPALADTYGWILHKSGDSTGALQALRQASEGLPDNRTVKLHLIEVLKAVGRSEEAQQQLENLKKSGNSM